MTDLVVEERGSGPPVVLVHAGIADRHMWDREFEEWSADRRVVRYDVRGYGESPDGAEDYWDHEDLRDILDDLGIAAAAVVGASNGGRIALDLAVTDPGRVAALVLVGAGTPGMTPPPELVQLWEAQEDAIEAGDYGVAVDLDVRLWLAGVGRSLADVDPDVVTRVAGWCHANLRRELAAAGGTPQRVEPLPKERLGEVSAPTLAIVGEYDQPLMRRVGDLVARGVADGRLVVVEGTGHLPSLERPEVFDELVLRFLDDVL